MSNIKPCKYFQSEPDEGVDELRVKSRVNPTWNTCTSVTEKHNRDVEQEHKTDLHDARRPTLCSQHIMFSVK